MSGDPAGPDERPGYVVFGEWLCIEVDGCTCEGRDMHGLSAHREGCGLEPVATFAQIEAALRPVSASPATTEAEPDPELDLRRKARELTGLDDSPRSDLALIGALCVEVDRLRAEAQADREASEWGARVAERVDGAVAAALGVAVDPDGDEETSDG